MQSWGYLMYRLRETREARRDLTNLAAYMIYSLKNGQAAKDFLKSYKKQIHNLAIFPLAYRGVSFGYQGKEIRLKTFSSYNIFFVVDAKEQQITVLRVLKDRQNWKAILQDEEEYSF